MVLEDKLYKKTFCAESQIWNEINPSEKNAFNLKLDPDKSKIVKQLNYVYFIGFIFRPKVG